MTFNKNKRNDIRGSLTVDISFTPSRLDSRRVDVKFQACRIIIPPLKLDWNFPLGVIGPTGWLSTTYIDDNLRITRGHKGSVFVLTRPSSTLLNWNLNSELQCSMTAINQECNCANNTNVEFGKSPSKSLASTTVYSFTFPLVVVRSQKNWFNFEQPVIGSCLIEGPRLSHVVRRNRLHSHPKNYYCLQFPRLSNVVRRNRLHSHPKNYYCLQLRLLLDL